METTNSNYLQNLDWRLVLGLGISLGIGAVWIIFETWPLWILGGLGLLLYKGLEKSDL